MSLVVKIVIPVLIIGGLVWLYMTKYPATAQAPQTTSQQVVQENPQEAAAKSTTDAQLQTDLKAIDGDIQTASDANASVDQSFNDTPVAQTE